MGIRVANSFFEDVIAKLVASVLFGAEINVLKLCSVIMLMFGETEKLKIHIYFGTFSYSLFSEVSNSYCVNEIYFGGNKLFMMLQI